MLDFLNFKQIITQDKFMLWINDISEKEKLLNLAGYREVFYYKMEANFEIQHYKFTFKRLAQIYLEDHAIIDLMSKYVNNIYGDAAFEYLSLIPSFLRNLQNEDGFRRLKKK